MTGPINSEIGRVAQQLIHSAGGYLRNPIRQAGITCSVCTTPSYGYPRCGPCNTAASSRHGLADLVAPLTYAIGGGQSAIVLRHYKDNPDQRVKDRHSLILNWLVYLGIMIHEPCIEKAVGHPVTHRLAVPSLRRGATHPFVQLAHQTGAISDKTGLQPVRGAVSDHQTISAEKFAIAPSVDLSGQHIMILDDTWTTGANAQSAALTARKAGATAVSVLVVGRWIKPEWSAHWPDSAASTAPPYASNGGFISKYLGRDYDPYLCPVTGQRCQDPH